LTSHRNESLTKGQRVRPVNAGGCASCSRFAASQGRGLARGTPTGHRHTRCLAARHAREIRVKVWPVALAQSPRIAWTSETPRPSTARSCDLRLGVLMRRSLHKARRHKADPQVKHPASQLSRQAVDGNEQRVAPGRFAAGSAYLQPIQAAHLLIDTILVMAYICAI